MAFEYHMILFILYIHNHFHAHKSMYVLKENDTCFGPSSVYAYTYNLLLGKYHLAGFNHLDCLQERSHLTNFISTLMIILLPIICWPTPPFLVVEKLDFSSSQESSASQDCCVGNDIYLASVEGSEYLWLQK